MHCAWATLSVIFVPTCRYDRCLRTDKVGWQNHQQQANDKCRASENVSGEDNEKIASKKLVKMQQEEQYRQAGQNHGASYHVAHTIRVDCLVASHSHIVAFRCPDAS